MDDGLPGLGEVRDGRRVHNDICSDEQMCKRTDYAWRDVAGKAHARRVVHWNTRDGIIEGHMVVDGDVSPSGGRVAFPGPSPRSLERAHEELKAEMERHNKARDVRYDSPIEGWTVGRDGTVTARYGRPPRFPLNPWRWREWLGRRELERENGSVRSKSPTWLSGMFGWTPRGLLGVGRLDLGSGRFRRTR